MSRPRYKAPTGEDISERQFLIKDQWDNVVLGANGQELVGAVLDSQSQTEEYFGEIGLAGQAAAGIEQLLHLEIGEMVKHTGEFQENPYGRVAVSMGPILQVIYADDPYVAGNYVRMQHNKVNRTDSNGHTHHALDPDAFYWAHDTFVQAARRNRLHFTSLYQEHKGMSDEQIAVYEREVDEQWQLESNTWYSYYGMPMNNVPEDYNAYVPWRKDLIDNHLDLEHNEMAKWAIDAAQSGKAPRPELVPKRVWRLAEVALAPATEIFGLVTIGEISPDIREKFGIPFSTEQQKQLDELRTIAKAVNLLPDPMTYVPQAYDSLVRERGGHKNRLDRMIYTGQSLGARAVKRVVEPVRKLAA